MTPERAKNVWFGGVEVRNFLARSKTRITFPPVAITRDDFESGRVRIRVELVKVDVADVPSCVRARLV